MKINLVKFSIFSLLLASCSANHSADKNDLTAQERAINKLVASNRLQINSFNDYLNQLKKRVDHNSPLAISIDSYYGERKEAYFPVYVDYLKVRALEDGVSAQLLDNIFADVEFLPHVIKADRAQLGKKPSGNAPPKSYLNNYLKRVLPKSKINEAQKRLNEHRTTLKKITARTGVPEKYIVALWGLESYFGKLQGKEDVISSMATLAFEGRREEFFTKELIAAMEVLQKGYITRDKLKGSWAGAMGQCQFMPSSLLKYGMDGDGDGKIDIWNNIDDVFASIANYLSIEGWQKILGWGNKVVLPTGFNVSLAGFEDNKSKSIKAWQSMGIKLATKDTVQSPSIDQLTWLVIVDNDVNEAYLVSDNYRTIRHWNRSNYFAISVGTLAEQLQ